MENRVVLSVALAIVALLMLALPADAQRPEGYPPFTLVMQITEYDAKGEPLTNRLMTHYHSASGDWRVVGNSAGYEVAAIYRRDQGVYTSNARTGILLKRFDRPRGCPIRTADQLRRDPKFTRTELVSGFTAYVISERFPVGYLMETFFVPELGGGTPFKRVYSFDDGHKIIEEPINVALGEPSASDVKGPDYVLIEGIPKFNKQLIDKIISRPEPVYPPDALVRRISGKIYVSVIVDESGRVIHAGSNTPIPFLTDAAVEAAYQAWFSPTIVNGKPVVTRGVIIYHFVLPPVTH